MNAKQMIESAGYKITPERVSKLSEIIKLLSNEECKKLRLETCSDENTGRRYGEAKCRAGRAKKIGGTTYQYQLWAVWN